MVFSDDRDLVDNGFAGQAWWTEAAGDVLIVAEADWQLVSVLTSATWTTVGTGYGTVAVVRAARRAPVVTIMVAIGVLAGVYLLARRYAPGRVRATLKELGAFAVTMWRDATDSQQAGAARLPWVEVPAGRPPCLEERCARILARVTGTLSADALHEQLCRDPAQPTPSVAEVCEALIGHPAFLQVDQDWWQLGEPAGALPPS